MNHDEMKQKLGSMLQTVKNDAPKNMEVIENKQKDVEDAHNFVEEKLKTLISISQDVLEESAEVAKQTGSPESFKSFSNVLKELSTVTKNIMDIMKMKKDMENNVPKDAEAPKTLTQNNTTIVFEGTTSQLLEKIKSGEVVDVPIEENEDVQPQ